MRDDDVVLLGRRVVDEAEASGQSSMSTRTTTSFQQRVANDLRFSDASCTAELNQIHHGRSAHDSDVGQSNTEDNPLARFNIQFHIMKAQGLDSIAVKRKLPIERSYPAVTGQDRPVSVQRVVIGKLMNTSNTRESQRDQFASAWVDILNFLEERLLDGSLVGCDWQRQHVQTRSQGRPEREQTALLVHVAPLYIEWVPVMSCRVIDIAAQVCLSRRRLLRRATEGSTNFPWRVCLYVSCAARQMARCGSSHQVSTLWQTFAARFR